jgi:hypothetical protein
MGVIIMEGEWDKGDGDDMIRDEGDNKSGSISFLGAGEGAILGGEGEIIIDNFFRYGV